MPSKYKEPYRASREAYARAVMAGDIPRPRKGSMEGNSLAALASMASRGRAPAEFESAFKGYWYHKEGNRQGESEADIEDMADIDADEDEDEDEE